MARASRPERPDHYFDPGVQQERTSLAWERTALATMLAGAVTARIAALEFHYVLGTFGAVWVAIGGGLLFWTGWRYESLHGRLRAGESPAHPSMTRLVGLVTVAFNAFALILVITIAVLDP